MFRHDLYRQGDKDVPLSLVDANGEVCLDMCRTCGKAEGELSASCTPTNNLCPRCAELEKRLRESDDRLYNSEGFGAIVWPIIIGIVLAALVLGIIVGAKIERSQSLKIIREMP